MKTLGFFFTPRPTPESWRKDFVFSWGLAQVTKLYDVSRVYVHGERAIDGGNGRSTRGAHMEQNVFLPTSLCLSLSLSVLQRSSRIMVSNDYLRFSDTRLRKFLASGWSFKLFFPSESPSTTSSAALVLFLVLVSLVERIPHEF